MSRISCCSRFCRRYASSTVTLRFLLDEGFPLRVLEGIRDGEDVLVASARLVDQNHVVRTERARFTKGLRERVRGFERWDQALFLEGELECGNHLGIGRRGEAGTSGVQEACQDWRDPHVVEASSHAVSLIHLPVAILQEVGLVALSDADARIRTRQPNRVL